MLVTGAVTESVLQPEPRAEVPELPGCAADGSSYQEAIANVQVIIDEWIETAEELGRLVPEPKGRRLIFA